MLLLSIALKSQDQMIYPNEHSESEFDVAINPLDSSNIILASVVIHKPLNEFERDAFLTIYYTRDFGASWKKSDFIGLYNDDEFAGDPVVGFDHEGNAVLVHIVAQDSLTRIACHLSQSKDGGETWELKYSFGDFVDKPWFEIDNSENSPNRGNIYLPIVLFDIELMTFNSDFELLNTLPIPNTDQLPSVVVNNTGEIITSNIEFQGDNIDLESHLINFGGINLANTTKIATVPDYFFNAPEVSRRFQATPHLAIDNSNGPYSGRVYFTYTGSESLNPDYFNVYLCHSDDNGINWSVPKIVHSDIRNSVNQFYSSIYVNEQGVLLLDWYDRTNFEPASLMTDFYLGISYDGGESFTETKLTSEPMDFNSVIPAANNFGIGEYHQLVATDNTAMAFWSDGRSNNEILNIYFAKVDINNPLTGVTENGLINTEIQVGPIFPQPLNDQCSIKIDLAKSFTLQYQILGLDGQLLNKSEWQAYVAGSHQIDIRVNLPAGAYILKLQDDQGYFNNSKFVVN